MREEGPLAEEILEQTLETAEGTEEQLQETDTQIVTEADDHLREDMPEQDTEAEMLQENLDEAAAAQAEEPDPEKEAHSVPESGEIPYHERYYLKYREGKRSTPLDLAGTKAFLQGLGFDGGELRQAREGKNCAEGFRNPEKNRNNQMRCSYCGAEISGVEFFRLPDGRMRCTTCSSTIVATKAEVEALCQRVIANMDNFFGATIDVPISVEVVDERKLKKKIGVPLGTKDSQSMLILGVAINKKRNIASFWKTARPGFP